MIGVEGFDEPLTPREISERTGGKITAEAVRSYCHRGGKFHPLPHVTVGKTGKHLRIRWSTFCKWYEEEEAFA